MKSVVEWRTNMIDVFGYEANLSAVVGVGGIAALTCNSPHCKKYKKIKNKFNFFPTYFVSNSQAYEVCLISER